MEIKVIDLNKHPKIDNKDHIIQGGYLYSQGMIDEIENEISKSKSVLIFLNKKGSYRNILCQACGQKRLCRSCNKALSYLEDKNETKCFFCGLVDKTTKCKTCSNEIFQYKSVGIETIAKDFEKIYKNQKIVVVDADSKPENWDQNEPTIYIGTTVLSKGHDFENISLVCVLQFDELLCIPDHKTQEKALNTLIQIAGRSGRRDNQSKLIIQTFNPDNPLLSYVQPDNFERFLDEELNIRKRMEYPPFASFILLSLRHKDKNKIEEMSKKSLEIMTQHFKDVLSPIPYRNFYHGKYTVLMLLKNPNRKKLHELIKKEKILSEWKVDVEPSNLFEAIE